MHHHASERSTRCTPTGNSVAASPGARDWWTAVIPGQNKLLPPVIERRPTRRAADGQLRVFRSADRVRPGGVRGEDKRRRAGLVQFVADGLHTPPWTLQPPPYRTRRPRHNHMRQAAARCTTKTPTLRPVDTRCLHARAAHRPLAWQTRLAQTRLARPRLCVPGGDGAGCRTRTRPHPDRAFVDAWWRPCRWPGAEEWQKFRCLPPNRATRRRPDVATVRALVKMPPARAARTACR